MTLFIAILLLVFLQGFTKNLAVKPVADIPKEESSLVLNEAFIKISHLGHGRFLGAITWVLTLLEGDIEHYKKTDGNSWMFHRFKSISLYDPFFYENYLYGGQYLSIIKDDILGASEIYQKGLDKYPNDFWLNYHAGFHFYFEADKREEALKAYTKIENNPGTKSNFPGLPRFLAKLRAENGSLDSAYEGLLISYQSLPPTSRLKKGFHNTLYSIKAKIDLNCLNNLRLTNCDISDFDGNAYKKEKGSYVSNKSPSAIFLKSK